MVDDGGPDSGGAAGTGFVISPDGVIVTNNHVVEGAEQIQAVFSDGTTRDAEVLGRNPPSDLAVVKVDATGLPDHRARRLRRRCRWVTTSSPSATRSRCRAGSP